MKRILVVDDQVDCSEPMARLLELCGFEARVAGDGKQALAMLEGFGPDLILLDLSMPGMDGFDFLRVLRGMPRWADVPVIVFSAIYNEKMHTGLRLLGVNDVFSKGETDFDILIRRIGEVSGQTAAAAGAARKILVVEDDGETRMALERLLRDYGYEVSGVGSADEAVREAEGKKFDLAVVDLGLEEGQGVKILKGLVGKAECKVLGLRSGEEKEHPGSGSGAGEKGFSKMLRKPVPVDELMETIRGMTD